jgi:acyl-CoA dehydrogenase
MLTILLCVVLAVAIIWALAYHAASAALWSGVVGVTLLALTVTGVLTGATAGILWFVFLAAAVIANVKSIRMSLLTVPIFDLYKKVLPQMSQTEQEALEAGTVWWDGDLFSGKPDWNKWLNVPKAKLTAEESRTKASSA